MSRQTKDQIGILFRQRWTAFQLSAQWTERPLLSKAQGAHCANATAVAAEASQAVIKRSAKEHFVTRVNIRIIE